MFIKIILACSFMFDSSAAAISGAPDFLTHLSAPQTPTVVAVARSLPVLETPLPAIEGIVTGALNLPTILPQTKARAEASEVVEKVQAFYKDTKRLRAKFRQVTLQKVMGRKQTSDGNVYIKKPGMMRWDYNKKKGKSVRVTKSFISDGKQLWAVFHDDKQFMKKKLEEDLLPVAVTFLYGKGDLAKDFTAEMAKKTPYGTAADYVLKLTPKKTNAQYKVLWLVVSPDNFRVTQSIVENSEGDTNQFRFFEPDTVKTLKDSWFVFAEKAAIKKDYRDATPTE